MPLLSLSSLIPGVWILKQHQEGERLLGKGESFLSFIHINTFLTDAAVSTILTWVSIQVDETSKRIKKDLEH